MTSSRLNQPLVDIETAKATVELPSPYAGTVVALHGNVGDVMEVHKPLITFEVGGNAAPATKVAATPASQAEAARELIEQSPEAIGAGREAVLVGYGVANEDGVATRKHRRAGAHCGTIDEHPLHHRRPPPRRRRARPHASLAPRCTPPVRLYAKQHGVDLTTVAGTGRDGLITRDDVERALSGAPVVAPAPRVVRRPVTAHDDFSLRGQGHRVLVERTRRKSASP